jgi:putative tricarboxylic transport membrane protein
VLAMVAVTAMVGTSLIRGLMSLTFGLFLGLIGIESQTGQARFTFGVPSLWDGVDVVIVIVGLFAIGETLYIASRMRGLPGKVATLDPVRKGTFAWLSRSDWSRSWRPWLRGTALGFPFGALPSGGAEIPTFLSYTLEKRRTKGKHKEEFGKGAIEGVAGPEAANNASFSGVLVPLLTLGIPTSATAAVLLVVFNYFDIPAGPQLFEKSPALVWALIASLYVGNLMLLALNLPMIRVWVKVLQIPRPLLYAGILVFATLGVYAVSGNIIDVMIAYAIGVVAMFMRHLEFPIAPVILGVILGPMMETQFRRALLLSDNDLTVFVRRPLTLILLLLAVAMIGLPYVPRLFARKRLVFGEED